MKKSSVVFLSATFVALTFPSSIQADSNVFKDIGQAFKKAGKDIGKTGKKVGKDIGHASKNAVKD